MAKSFTIRLIIILVLVFFIHIGVLFKLEAPPYENAIILSYTVNFLAAFSIYSIIYLVREKYKNQLGFIFITGSGLKFLLFFIFFYPLYKQDETITTLEFSAFFVPYATCLIVEVLGIAKLLNKQ
ncbi:DUF6168 family protein [Leptobacterium sp. I13]|uniref:DUF6168 family protein n=1 Tax=Leptobacterium meishanense TaxID=3128904 RepID=UPI0030EC98EA